MLPNFVQSSIPYLETILHKDMIMLEWGCGASTLYFADRVKELYVIEHDLKWFERIREKVQDKKNVFMFYRPYPPAEIYTNAPFEVLKRFHIIEIDGRLRVACCKVALQNVYEDGYIVFDDIQNERYMQARQILSRYPVKEFVQSTNRKTTAIYNIRHPETF